MIIKFKMAILELKKTTIEDWPEMYKLALIAKSRREERAKKIAMLILKDREMVQKMIAYKDDELLGFLKSHIDYDNIGLKGSKNIPFKAH